MDDIDRFGLKFRCNSTCCTVRPTPPVIGSYGPPFVEPYGCIPTPVTLPAYIPPREQAFCASGSAACLPSPYGAGWIEVGYVYSVRPRHRHTRDTEENECDWTPLSNSRHSIPRYAFQSTRHRRHSFVEPALSSSSARNSKFSRNSRNQKRKRFDSRRENESIRRSHGGGCHGSGRCNGRHSDCRECGEEDSSWSGGRDCGGETYHVHHHHYEGGRKSDDDCCYPRRYRLFARAPYPYSCRAYGTSNYYQYAVLDTNNPSGVLIVLDSNPFFRGARRENGGGSGFNRRWQEAFTGDLLRIPGERGPFRVHLFADDYNPPPGSRHDAYAADGYEY